MKKLQNKDIFRILYNKYAKRWEIYYINEFLGIDRKVCHGKNKEKLIKVFSSYFSKAKKLNLVNHY